MKKVRRTTSPFTYEPNQIPYDYTVEVINRFKGLELLDRVPEGLWMEVHNTVQEAVTKTIPKGEKKSKKAKWSLEEDLQIYEERREAKSKGERERYTQLNAEFQRVAKRDRQAFLNEQCKEIQAKIEWKRLGISKKMGGIKGTFHARMGTMKDRNGRDLRDTEEIRKRRQEHTELYRKGLNDPDNHDGVVLHLELDTME